MGIANDLGYTFRRPNVAQRAVQLIASTKPGAKSLSMSMRHLDDMVQKLSKGQTSSGQILAGLAVLEVTTIGRKSGQPRTGHLIAIPYLDTLAVLGTNFGGKSTPAWVFNVEANPQVTVSYKGKAVDAVARRATPDEVEGVLKASESVYKGYRKYQERISGRELRVFLLEPR